MGNFLHSSDQENSATPQAPPYLVSSEYANTVAVQDVPHANGTISRTRGHIVWVRVELGAGDITQMPRKYAQRLVVVGGP